MSNRKTTTIIGSLIVLVGTVMVLRRCSEPSDSSPAVAENASKRVVNEMPVSAGPRIKKNLAEIEAESSRLDWLDPLPSSAVRGFPATLAGNYPDWTKFSFTELAASEHDGQVPEAYLRLGVTGRNLLLTPNEIGEFPRIPAFLHLLREIEPCECPTLAS